MLDKAASRHSGNQRLTAWRVTFRRDRFTSAHRAESLVVVAANGLIQPLLEVLQLEHRDVIIEKVESLGPARVA